MASERKPGTSDDRGPASVPETGGTLVGFAPLAPATAPADVAGETVIGLKRLAIPPAGVPAPRGGSFGPPPDFRNLAMPTPSPLPSGDSGGTVVGMSRVAPGAPALRAVAPPTADGTIVGMSRIAPPGAARAGGFGAPTAPPREAVSEEFGDVGGTVVGLARVSVPGAAATAAPLENDAGGTVVGMGRVVLPPPGTFGGADASESGGTMMNIPAAAVSPVSAASFARPSGPPPAYAIIKHLGGGELGQVFHARHKETGVEYALRIVKPDIAAVAGAIEALRDVVALAQGARHDHLGQQYELDETASPTLVLEYVPGKLLAAIMQERGAAPTPAVIDLGVRLCSAIAAAHGAGLAHGRVHAGNVVLEARTGRWVLLDLGHSYAIQGLEPAHDLYALGALLYEMATGHSPFEQGDQAPDPRTYVPALAPKLSALLMRTLAADPALWFPSAAELVQALVRARTTP